MVGVPNPNARALVVELSGPADSLEAEIYSVAMGRVAEIRSSQAHLGYNTLYLPAAWVALPNGLYVARVRARKGGEQADSQALKLMRLR